MNKNHIDCINKLMEIGRKLDFQVGDGRGLGKMYHMGNPDCVWYYKGKGAKELYKIAKGDKCKYLPLIAFEIANTEGQKALRGSLMSLQLANASASIIVLVDKSVKHKSYLKKLVGRYSYGRFRIWTKKDVDGLYERIINM